MKIDTDKAYAVLGEIAQNGIQQVTGMTQQIENTATQSQQSLASVQESTQQIPMTVLQQMRIRSM